MLDTVTLALLAALASVVAAALIGVMAIVYPAVPGLRQWAFGESLIAVGLAAFLIRDLDAPLVLSVVVANGLIYTSLYCLATGNRAYVGEHPPRPLAPFATALTIHLTALAFLTVVVDWYSLRSSLNSIGFAGLSVLIAWELWPMLRRPGRQVGARIVIGAFLLHALFHLGRAVSAFTLPASESFLDDSFLAQATYLAEFTLALAVLAGFVTLVGEFLRRRIEELAEIDSLTGVLNRRAFFLLAPIQLDLARRQEEPISMLMIDIDRFKGVNDRHGHQVGDVVLQQVAETLGKELRAHDLVGRYGGEEFVLLLFGLDAVDGAAVAERLRAQVDVLRVPSEGGDIDVTVSIGVAGGPTAASASVDDLIRAADKALYRAKDLGRNRVEAFGVTTPGHV